MAEGNDMAIRILRSIHGIFKRDSEPEEFVIIPTDDNTKNKSPVLYEQRNLGLESWCVKLVYNYASLVLLDSREALRRGKLPFSKMEDLNHLLIGALLINPDVTTFWNMKRDLVEKDILAVEEELYFSKVVLTRKSKSNEAFGYRRWLLKRILDKMAANNLHIPLALLQNELFVTNLASEKSPNNYHSWNHRIWCLENIVPKNQSISNIVYSELSYSQEWINNHVSEHAGYHYRQYLIKLVRDHKKIVTLYNSYYNFVVKTLLNTTNDGDCSNLLTYLFGKANKTKFLEEICSYVNYVCILLYDLCVVVDKLNKLYPEHEALFCHRKFLIYSLLKVPHEYHGLDSSPRRELDLESFRGSPADVEENRWPKLFKRSPRCELYNVYSLVSTCEKNFASQNCSVMQLDKYRKWLTHVVGFE
ncbi:protein prenyltransferase alpha subunit repeat-containing protein tempura isoform X1 [Leptinotarsa decemlineata]|uniref:protein prenyltransferase alpha subunit repeat-containing protein tempura isoform X1 n=1 Tax=Leptinotarsa decemlineata TaxID=7539 RepID=UPI003D307445